ncbi:DMT family transporter [Ammoniphilus sp. CFH 90114]|uniref:DMT family transporter n=1 Tax=Ammoniphilus sp. CFH 90114 TaxID=2493665 RepID=UPI00100EDC24|nr:DMT family transporter [Ammoniphilus sp. CFH 90114]RXT06462.1 DMT family transporter [Ammoniphilus sp. CFH 90114]
MKRQTLVFLVLANLFWAGNYVLGKYVVAEVSPIQITFVRWLMALCFLYPMAQFIERPNWRSIWTHWKILGAMSILGVIGYNMLLYQALRYTSPLNASLVNALNPAVIVIFSVLLLKEKLSKLNLLGFVISLFGVLLILTQGKLFELFHIEYNAGDLLMVAAILVWTFYSIIGRKISNIPPISATVITVCIGLLLTLPFALYAWSPVAEWNDAAKWGIVYMGLFPTVGSFLLWNLAVRDIGPSRSGIFLNLITVFTAIFSVILGEKISIIQIVGGLSVFVGVYLTSKQTKVSRVKETSQAEAI